MTANLLFSREELADAAFYLLSSSSPGRYIRMAKRAAMRSQLRARVKQNPDMLLDLVDHARRLWEKLLASEQRDIPEFELATILPILAQTAVPEVDGFLIALSLVDKPTTAWIAMLARKLFQERASNTSSTDIIWDISDQPLNNTLSRVAS